MMTGCRDDVRDEIVNQAHIELARIGHVWPVRAAKAQQIDLEHGIGAGQRLAEITHLIG